MGPPEEGPDHGEHLHVAHAHPLAAPQAEVGLADRPENRPSRDRADRRRLPPRLPPQAARQPRRHARQGDDVGQDAVPEVDRGQRDHRRCEEQADRQQRLPAELPVLQDEHERGDGLHRGIGRRYRGPAGPAAAAEGHPAQHRHVLEPPQTAAAGRTPGGGRDDRFAAGKAMDADVEKAAGGEPRRDHQPDRRGSGHRDGDPASRARPSPRSGRLNRTGPPMAPRGVRTRADAPRTRRDETREALTATGPAQWTVPASRDEAGEALTATVAPRRRARSRARSPRRGCSAAAPR